MWNSVAMPQTDQKMNNQDEYKPLRNPGRKQRRNIEFSDRDFDDIRERPEARGLRDEHQAEDYDDDYYTEENRDSYPNDEYYPEDDRYPDGEYYQEDDRYPRDDYYPQDGRGDYYPDESREEPPRRAPSRQREDYYPRDDRDGYRAGYRDGFRDNDASRGYRGDDNQNQNEMETPRKESFRKRHPVMMHFLYAIAATILAVWMALWFLDFWTFHGQERAVPDVKGQSFDMALGNISRAGLRAVVTDSVYDSYARPGTVVEQSPIPLAKIKRGGTVYLTLVAYTPKMVTIPDFYDVSERQARSMLEGLGITQIMTVSVPSEYAGLVLGAKFNGVSLRPGAKVPITAVITLEVGRGMDEVLPSREIVDTAAIEQTIEALNID